MARTLDTSRGQLAFAVDGVGADLFQVIRYRGREGLCQLYRFEVELASSDSLEALDNLVGKPAVLSINTPNGERWFHGIISRFAITGQTTGQTYYRAELVPSLWLLTHRYSSRIFQNQAVSDIVLDVLAQGGISPDQVLLALAHAYEPREYCVQYRETDYNFICRLMEEEGIWWYFQQSQDAHVLVIADSPAAYRPIEQDATLAYRPPSGMNVEAEHISHFRLAQAVRPGAVVLNDFNFENPAQRLEADSRQGRDARLEFYDYPGEYRSMAQGNRLAALRAEEFESSRVLGVGQSNCHRLSPARVFNLVGHSASPVDGSYMVSSVIHQGKQATTRSSTGSHDCAGILGPHTYRTLQAAQRSDDSTVRELAAGLLAISTRLNGADPTANRELTHWLYHGGQVARDLSSIASATGGNPLEGVSLPNLLEDKAPSSLVDRDAPVYECGFECIPSKVAYRPPRITPWPVVRGTQTARVVGPSSEEIYTDKYGRVKVQFNWDRAGRFDERSSCWIRVSQGSAGGQYGCMFIPRIGQEVIVDFLEGDPDKPIIIGRVYNADNMPPYPLPAEKTKSVIKTNSSTGGRGTNEIRFEDLDGKEQILLYAQKDLHLRANNDRVENVDHDRHLTVKENKFELVKKSKHAEVKLDFNEHIGGKKSLKVKGDVGEEFKGSHSEDVGEKYYLKVGSDVVIEAEDKITLKVGKNFIKIDKDEITIKGEQVKINCSGAKAGKGKAVELTKPKSSIDADEVHPGKDVTYAAGGGVPGNGVIDADIAGLEWRRDEDERKRASWIEIELRDEMDRPVAGAKYEIIPPGGGEPICGRLDENGRAHRYVPEPGMCQITFPKYDREKWERRS